MPAHFRRQIGPPDITTDCRIVHILNPIPAHSIPTPPVSGELPNIQFSQIIENNNKKWEHRAANLCTAKSLDLTACFLDTI